MKSSREKRSSGPSLRLLRVGENVRHAIATVLARGDIQDPALAGTSVTVSEVRVSRDFRNATIFVMPLGGDPDLVVTKALNKNSAHIRGALSKMVTMKFLPRLKFKLDESFDEAANIEAILRRPQVLADINAPDTPEASDTDKPTED
jgi:ribosome-binding factor A